MWDLIKTVFFDSLRSAACGKSAKIFRGISTSFKQCAMELKLGTLKYFLFAASDKK